MEELRRINWTQIDTENIPTGVNVELGSNILGFRDIYADDIHISGVSFFDYLVSLGYTGTTNSDITVSPNSGLSITGKTLSTTYNTTLDPTLSSTSSVGGIPAGTTVADLSGKTFVEFVDDLIFPLSLPTYTIPTITFSGLSSGIREIGSTISGTINVYGDKNDAGPFTQLRVLRNGSPIITDTSLTQSSITNINPQFGYVDPNNPNYRYTIPSGYSESYIIPYNTYPGTVTYRGDGNYGAGLPKQNNKGGIDGRLAQVRSVNAPQDAGVNFNSSTITMTTIYPYFYGTSPTLPTPSSISSQIATGDCQAVLTEANGTLSIPYNVVSPGLFIWVAYFNSYTTKTKWYVNALDNGNIDGSFITTAVTQPTDSVNNYWFGISYKMHWSQYLTIQSTIEFRNS